MKLKKSTYVFIFQKYGKFWSVLIGHFIKQNPLISEEWSFYIFYAKYISIVFVDSDGSTCSKATFTFGGGSTSRKYDIKVPIYGPDYLLLHLF